MSKHRLRVGIIGFQPRQSWAARAHIPALRAMPDRFDIAGVANGATMLSILVGHTLAAMQDIIGSVKAVSSNVGNRRNSALSLQDGKPIAMTAPDQMLVNGVTDQNILFSLHYRGGTAPDGDGLIWELNGTKGVIRITGPSGHTQMVPRM